MIYHYNEVPIFYKVTGQGPVIVLLHGFLESVTMWKDIAPGLSQRHTVISIDLPGHGQSNCVAEVHTMELFADVVVSLLSFLAIKSASFVGHSMGGYVLLALAEVHPEMMDSLVLLNSTSQKDGDDRKANRDRALQFMQKEKKTIISMAISNLFDEASRTLFSSQINQLKLEALSFPNQGITAAIKGMRDRKDRTLVLKRFSKRKLLICGKKDTIVPLTVSKEISETTNTPIKIMESGHMSWLENPTEIVKMLLFSE